MNRELTIHRQIQQHLVNKPITFTIIEPWENYMIPVLQAVSLLINDQSVKRVIILASKKTIEQGWLVNLHRSPVTGGVSYIAALGKRKKKQSAFYAGKTIILTNDESVSWMQDLQINKNDMLIVDELSRYRCIKSERYHITKTMIQKVGRIAAFSRIPLPHGLSEIWEELFLIDNGNRLGRSKYAFLDRYFFVNRIWVNDHIKRYIIPKENAAAAIARAINDIFLDISLTESNREYKQEKRNIYVELSRSEISRYRLMAQEYLFQIDNDHQITVPDSTVVACKLLQLASGTVYDDKKEIIYFHERKINMLKRLLGELGDRNILIVYWYKHELSHILQHFPEAIPIKCQTDINDWNNGKIHIGLINSSMGGRPDDLSKGGNIIIWFSLTWSMSLYTKTNERIRQADGYSVIIHLVAAETIDEAVIKILDNRKKDNALLLDTIRSLRI